MMKYIQIALVIALIGFIGSCSLFLPKSTYYYIVSSNCTANGGVVFNMPNGQFSSQNNPLYYYVTNAFKFKIGDTVSILASFNVNSIRCIGENITVTIMKGEAIEGSLGTGGSVWKTATARDVVMVSGIAN